MSDNRLNRCASFTQFALFYQKVLAQQPKDKNKIYSLHEPDVYVIAKGKDHKQYEYGATPHKVENKQASEAPTEKTPMFGFIPQPLPNASVCHNNG
jgi:hypothetical protein